MNVYTIAFHAQALEDRTFSYSSTTDMLSLVSYTN